MSLNLTDTRWILLRPSAAAAFTAHRSSKAVKPPAVCWAWSRSNPVFSLNFRAAGAPEGQAVRRTASAAKPPASAEPKRPSGAPSPANCKLAISRCFFPMQRPGPVLPAPLHRPSPAPCRAGNPADSLDQNLRRRLEPARRAVRPEAEPGGLRPPKPPLGGGLLCGPPAAFHPIFP